MNNTNNPTEPVSGQFVPTDRTRVRRYPARAKYERATIEAILDEGMVCHVGFVHDGHPFVLPTMYVRDGERILIHGSPLSRMLTGAAEGLPLCVTVTLLDGVVMARSAFHHSMNYRSVAIIGRAHEVVEPAAKLEAMRALVERLIPGRWDEVRQPTPGEIAGTRVLEIPLLEASAKVRTGGPVELAEDESFPVWAGVVPLSLTPGEPIPDAKLASGIEAPEYVRRWRCA
jgi:nitroimidazol reductase NimA-like FMN-containing flavoprotein (pyridoxamine 5'-phosphate oxidase superfamily)